MYIGIPPLLHAIHSLTNFPMTHAGSLAAKYYYAQDAQLMEKIANLSQDLMCHNKYTVVSSATRYIT